MLSIASLLWRQEQQEAPQAKTMVVCSSFSVYELLVQPSAGSVSFCRRAKHMTVGFADIIYIIYEKPKESVITAGCGPDIANVLSEKAIDLPSPSAKPLFCKNAPKAGTQKKKRASGMIPPLLGCGYSASRRSLQKPQTGRRRELGKIMLYHPLLSSPQRCPLSVGSTKLSVR